MTKTQTFILAALLLVVALLGAASRAPSVHAQTGTTLTPANGSVRGGVYSLPAAGLSFDLPQVWERTAYQWNEVWGTSADARLDGASYVVDWIYSPTVSTYGPSTLLTLAVYRPAAWNGSDADVVAENASWVVVASMTRTSPYPLGSTDAQRFETLSLTMDEVEAAVSLTGEATASDEPGRTTFVEPDLWCQFAGTGATTVNGERANFDCDTDDNSIVVLAGEVTLGDEGWEITRATVVNSNGTIRVRSTEEMLVSHIELEDGTICAEAGTGATFGVNGERVNYSCEEAGIVLAGDIELGDEGWEILKATVESTDDGFETLDSGMELISALGVTSLN